LRGCPNCEQAFFVWAKFQQTAIFSIGKNLGLFHCQIWFFFWSKSPDSIPAGNQKYRRMLDFFFVSPNLAGSSYG
jgi:hypothetical protein